jgi:hypothetical protein
MRKLNHLINSNILLPMEMGAVLLLVLGLFWVSFGVGVLGSIVEDVILKLKYMPYVYLFL